MNENIETLSGNPNLQLPEFSDPPESPLQLLRDWVQTAMEQEVREPWAVTLATADVEGRPSTRTVMIKDIDDSGLVFASTAGSRKGQELEVNPWASVTFFWRERLQQVTAAGAVEIMSAEESDAQFDPRPRAARASAAVSWQSRPLDDEAALRQQAQALIESAEPIKRPAEWLAYRIVPQRMEFWYGSPDRLHRRLQYLRPDGETASWATSRLQP